MPWTKLDDGFWCHPKIISLTPPAGWLYVRSLNWCGQQLTDGEIPRGSLGLFDAPEALAHELVAAGLWCETRDGWQVNDYQEYNPSREKVESERASKRARQQRWRDKKQGQLVVGDVDASTDASVTPAPTRPDPTPVNPLNPPSGFPNKVNRQTVTADEVEAVEQIVAHFVEVFGSKRTASTYARPIIGRLRENDDLTVEQFCEIVSVVHAGDHWWTGKGDPRVIFGKRDLFATARETWENDGKAILRQADKAKAEQASVEAAIEAQRAAWENDDAEHAPPGEFRNPLGEMN